MNLKFLNDFKTFILRGNVVDLAVGVVIGAAFQTVVKSFVDDIISPIIPSGTPGSFASFGIPVYGGHFIKLGDFLSTLLSFMITAAVVYFLVVRPINMLTALSKRVLPTEETKRDCPFCLSSIPSKATRCAFCTADVPPVAEAPRPTLSEKLHPQRLRVPPPRRVVQGIENSIERRMQKQGK
jgi:large conductance mechanosensitive channel